MLPLSVHGSLPCRVIENGRMTIQQKPANGILFQHEQLINERWFVLQREIPSAFPFVEDRVLIPLLILLHRIPGYSSSESCQGGFHWNNRETGRSSLNPYITTHNHLDLKPILKVAGFLKWGPQNTFYEWGVDIHSFYGHPSYSIAPRGMNLDPDLLSFPLADRTKLPISRTVVDRLTLDINTLTLGLLLDQAVHGDALDYYLTDDE